MLPTRLGRYEVLGQLAAGGMAEILLARLSGPGDFRRAVVIKRVLRSYATNASFVRMFLHEARIVAALRHPNLVHVQELGEEDGEPFLVMEYVAGENAASLLKRCTVANEPLDPRLAAHLVAETCAGLHVAHELTDDDGEPQNLVHRDVSPQNVLVSYDGHVKLVDFGVALVERRPNLTEPGELKGKLAYMSPEQGRGLPLDRRSDLFSLGIVLYELSTGRRLFQRPSAARCIDAICREPVVPPSRVVLGSYPAALEAIVMRALSKDPDDRYRTAAEMRLALLDLVRELPSPVEALGETMTRLFPDRIAEKRELVRKVADGEGVTHVPAGETDEAVVVPVAPEETRVEGARAATGSSRSLAFRRATTIGVVAFIAAAAAVTVHLRQIANEPRAVLVGAPTVVAATSSAAVDPPPASVLVHIESRPEGARVVLDGRERGPTPLDVSLPRDTRPVALELRKDGHETARQAIVPDSDQKLFIALTLLHTPARPAGTPKRAVRAPATATATGFRRFD